MNGTGVILGLMSLVIIGMWHGIVVKGEYYLGRRVCTILFLAVGAVCIGASLWVRPVAGSACLALFGFAGLWGIKEVREQEQRVAKGWFPENPNRGNKIRWKALQAAFPYTVPIMTGFSFLGFAYGVYMNVSGFSFVYPMVMSLVIFGGSLEFVAVSMLLAPFAPLQTFLMALVIQARHLFYGIAMLDRFKGMGWKRFFLIYGMCDETFSVNYTAEIPQGVDRGWFMLWVTALNYFYWFFGATLGGIAGSFLTIDTAGIDFVMTAMFVVIFMEQWMKEKRHITALIGLGAAAGCLALFGENSFMVPTMIAILVCLAVFRRPIEKAGGFAS